MAVLIALIIVGTWAAGRAQIEYQVVDDQRIVIDEIAGMLLAMLLVPVTFKALLTGFILFRVFDIWKPVRSLEDLPAGAGVMADDLFAGLLANAGLRVASLFW